MGTLTDVAVTEPRVRRRRRARALVTRDGLSTLVFLLPFLVVFGLFAWLPIVRALVMSLQETNLVSEPVFVGPGQLPAGARRSPVRHRRLEHGLVRPAGARSSASRSRSSSRVIMSELRSRRGLYSALVYLPVVIPPVVAVLLWRSFFDAAPTGRVQHDPRLGRARAAALAPERVDGDALDRDRGDLGGRRRDGDHLPRRAAQRAARAVRRRRGGRGVHLAQDLARDAAPDAGGAVRDPDPAADRDGAADHGAAAVHARRAGQLHADGPAAHLPLRVPEQPRAATTGWRRP